MELQTNTLFPLITMYVAKQIIDPVPGCSQKVLHMAEKSFNTALQLLHSQITSSLILKILFAQSFEAFI